MHCACHPGLAMHCACHPGLAMHCACHPGLAMHSACHPGLRSGISFLAGKEKRRDRTHKLGYCIGTNALSERKT